MKPYKVILDDDIEYCKECGNGSVWTITDTTDKEPNQIGVGYGDYGDANEVCELMNEAYFRGIDNFKRMTRKVVVR